MNPLVYSVSFRIRRILSVIQMDYIAWVARCIRSIRGREPVEDGWEPVATESDEPIEMLESRTHG